MAIEEMNLHLNTNDETLKPDNLDLQHTTLLNALKESEDHFRQLILGLPVALYTTDAEGYINLYNHAAVELWGRVPEIGKDRFCGSWQIFRPDGDPLPWEKCPIALTLKGIPLKGNEEVVLMRPDGSKRHIIPYPRAIYNQHHRITGAINTLIDVTGIKKSEQELLRKERSLRLLTASLEQQIDDRTADLQKKHAELKKSEERYYRMIDEIEDYAIIFLDPHGIVQNWNRGAQKIKGYTESEIIGSHFRIFYREEDRVNKIPEKLIAEAAANGKSLHEGWRVRKDGSRFWGSITITALHDDANDVIGFSKVTRDLTEKKIAEDRISQYADDLKFQNQELEQFAFAAAHDMKEPLRKIQFYNSYLAEKISNKLTEKELEFLNRSITATARMQGLIDDLLAYSRTSVESVRLEPVNLNKIISEVIAENKETIIETNAVIEKDELPEVKVIPFQISQLFENLIGNALKYRSPDRTLHIKISAQTVSGDKLQQFKADPTINYTRITISDNGIGFDPAYTEKIFDLFQRLHNRTEYAGTGIGLAICKRIVQNHKGFISARGENNKGATFDIYFPQV